MDDNITLFARLHKNERIPVGDGFIFAAMEDFVQRYSNVGMAGPNYWMFAPSRAKHPPFTLNTRIYSCNLIRNDLPFRWRGKYNEDTDLSLRVLKAGKPTLLFNTFLCDKLATNTCRGGNTSSIYSEEDGMRKKAESLVEQHPDVVKISYRKFVGKKSCHHVVNYKPFKDNELIWVVDKPKNRKTNNYGLILKKN